MINSRENRKEKNRGITIVALVITIIVLLILAGVTLATLSGKNGILTKAQEAKEEYKKAQYQEEIELAKLQAHTEQGKYKIDAQEILKRVKEILNENELFKNAQKMEIREIDDIWQLEITTEEGWTYVVKEEKTQYVGNEEIKKEEIVEGDITFIYNNEWTNKPVLVNIEKDNNKYSNCKIRYALSSNPLNWYTRNQVEVEDNFTTIYVELVKEEKYVIAEAKRTIEKIDRLPPKVKIEQPIETTTDSIIITGTAEDQKATEKDGCSGIKRYEFSINGGEWVKNENPLQTFTGLEQNTVYKLKMKAIDNAGNEATEEIEITTEGVPGLKEEDEGSKRANVTFSHDPAGWTNGNVTVTIDTTEEGYTLQYNTGDRNNEADWKNYDSPVVMTENGSIYARLKDNANNKGEAIEHRVTTIEREKPTIQIQANTTAISQTKQITITAGDTGGSGLLDANYYQYYVSTSATELLGGSWQNYTSGTPFTVGSGITGTRYVWVKQIADNAGNKSETNRTINNDKYYMNGAYEFDNTVPTCTITANVNSPTNASSITYTFQFSETVTGFASSDITVANGTKGTFSTVSPSKYTLVVTNSGSCSQTVSIAEGVCTDTAGNGNTAQSKTITIDRVAPSCKITVYPTNATSVTYTFTWSETLANNTFTIDDITVTNGTKSTFTATTANKVYTLVVTGGVSGNQIVSIAAGTCTDVVGNSNTEAKIIKTIDRTPPTIGKIDVIDSTRATTNQGIVKGNKGVIRLSNMADQSQVVGYYITNESSTTPNVNATGWRTDIMSRVISYNITPDSTATYYIWIKDGAGNVSSRYEVKVQDAITQVGSVNYPSIQSAIDSISSSGTVILVANNYTGEEPKFPANKNIIFDLNEKTLKDRVWNDGTITIRNGIIDVTNQKDSGGAYYEHAFYHNAGNATISNAWLYSSGSTITSRADLKITENSGIVYRPAKNSPIEDGGTAIYIGKDRITETEIGGNSSVINEAHGKCISMFEALSDSKLILRGVTFKSYNSLSDGTAAVCNSKCPVYVYDSNSIENPQGGYAISTIVNWTYYGGCNYNGKILHK